MPCEIGTDPFPRLPFIPRSPDVLRRCIKDATIRRGKYNRIRPLEAFGHVRRRETHRVVGPDVDRALLAGATIDSRQQSTIAAGVEHIAVLRIGCDVSALAA